MTVDLFGTWVKLNRAQIHLHVFNDKVGKRLEKEQQSVSRHVEDNGAKHVYRFDGSTDLPDDWSAMIGDVLHNLRSALDHLAWQLVLAAGGKPNKWRNYFPIHLACPKDQDGFPVPLYLAGKVSVEAIEFIESVQPYHGRNSDERREALWLLHDLNRIDKHRELLVSFLAWDHAKHEVPPEGTNVTYYGRPTLVTGEPVGYFTVDPPDPDLDLNPEFVFDVFLPEVRPHSVREALYGIFKTTLWVVEECEGRDPNVTRVRP